MFDRRRFLLSSGLGLAALPLLSACGSKAVKLRPLPADGQVVCLGDSLTAGYGAAPQESYPAALGRLISRPVVNAGINGEVSSGALRRAPELLAQAPHTLLLVGIGGNDFLRKLPLSQTRENLLALARLASETVTVVLIAEPKPEMLSAAIGSLSDHPVYEEVAQATNTPLYSEGWSRILSDSDLRSDPIHANARGYALFAERLAKWLRDGGAFSG